MIQILKLVSKITLCLIMSYIYYIIITYFKLKIDNNDINTNNTELYYRLSNLQIENITNINIIYDLSKINKPEKEFPSKNKFKLLNIYINMLNKTNLSNDNCTNIIYIISKYIYLSDHLMVLYNNSNCYKMMDCFPMIEDINNALLIFNEKRNVLIKNNIYYHALINYIDKLTIEIIKCINDNCIDLNKYIYTSIIYSKISFNLILNETNIDIKINLIENLINNVYNINPFYIYEIKEILKIYKIKRIKNLSLLSSITQLIYYRIQEGIEYLNKDNIFKTYSLLLFTYRNYLNICIDQ